MTKKPRKIVLALPCYGDSYNAGMVRSLIYDMFPLVMRGDEVDIPIPRGHADIALLRAQIVADFLADKDATDLVMIDSDVAWNGGGLIRLIDHEEDVVAGAYPKREEPLTFMFRSELENGLWGNAETGLVEVLGVPAGFIRIKRHVLEKMWNAYEGELSIHDPMVPGEKTVRMFDPYYFDDPKVGRRCLSEDYAFCQRWVDLGGKIHLDTKIPMAHIGLKAYHGLLGQWMKEQQPPETMEAAE